MKLIAALLLTSTAAFCQALPDAPKPHKFFTKTNIALLAADFAVRTADAQSTEAFLHDPCSCYKEANIPSITSKGSAAVYGYSIGISLAVVGGSYLLHRLHHDELVPIVPIADALYDGRDVISNWDRHPYRSTK